MAKQNMKKVISYTLGHEGGYVDHPSDPGGATNMGVTRRVLAKARGIEPWAKLPKSEVKALTKTEAIRIYEKNYWRRVRGDDLTPGVDQAVYDFAVNSGVFRSSQYLQAVLGVVRDGKIGPKTLQALRQSDGKYVIKKVCAKRLAFLKGLKIWKVFGKGWGRRVYEVEAISLKMFLAATVEAPWHEQREEAKKIEKTAKGQDKAAGGAAGGGAAVGGGDAAINGDPNWLLIVGVALFVGIVAFTLISKARQNKGRALAHREAAEGKI